MEHMKKLEQASATKINEKTYRFTEIVLGSEVYMYLLIGEEKALLLDTGYGLTDVPSAIRRLTDLPLIVVNSHGHMDHILGNYMYPEVYMAVEDEEVYQRHTDPEYLYSLMKEIVTDRGLPEETLKSPEYCLDCILDCHPVPTRPLPEEMYFELGERRVFILKTPGHTPGSICLLDEKNGWLFAADTCCRDGVLLEFPEGTSVERFAGTIAELKGMAGRGLFTKIFPGHQVVPLTPEILDLYERNCRAVLDGNMTEQQRAEGLYVKDALAIRFRPDNIREERV